MAWEAVHVTHAILLLVTWYLIHTIVTSSDLVSYCVFAMESVHISSHCLASWGYSWEKQTNGYSYETRITFFDSCARFNVGLSIHTHLECAHILKSFMVRIPVLTGTSSIGWANDGVHNYFIFLGDAHLLRYSQTLGVVMFSIYLNVHLVPPILASRTGFSGSVFHRQYWWLTPFLTLCSTA